MLKLAIWGYTIAVTLTSLCVAALAATAENYYRHQLGGQPLPLFTQLLIEHLWSGLGAALPFFGIAGWATFRPPWKSESFFVFASLATLTIVVLFASTAVVLSLPLISVSIGF